MRLDRDGTGWKARFQFREMHTFSEQLRAYFPKTNNQDEKKKKVSGGGGGGRGKCLPSVRRGNLRRHERKSSEAAMSSQAAEREGRSKQRKGIRRRPWDDANLIADDDGMLFFSLLDWRASQ